MKEGYLVPNREKFAYGLGDLAINIGFGAIGFYMTWFIVNVGGISPKNAIMVISASKLWDAISDYLMGRISDKTKSRWGRRRPYIILGAIPMAVSFVLLWIVPSTSQSINLIYFIVMYLLYNTAFTIVAVPYNALLPELTSNYNERGAISGFKMGSSFIGTLIGAVGVPLICWTLLPQQASEYLTNKLNFPIMSIILAIILLVVLFITGFGTKERIIVKGTENVDGFFKTLLSFMKIKEFRLIMGMFLFNMIGFDVIMATIAFYFGDVLNIKGDMQTLFMGIPLIAAVIAAPFWVFIMNKYGKKKAYIGSAIYFIVALILCLFLPEISDEKVLLISLGFVTAIIGFGISASQVIPWAMLPDVIEIDEYKNGIRREGAFYGISTFLYKIASAIAISIVLLIIGWFGYKEAPLNKDLLRTDFVSSYEKSILTDNQRFEEAYDVSFTILDDRRFDSEFETLFTRNFSSKITDFEADIDYNKLFNESFDDAFIQPQSAIIAVKYLITFLPGLFFAISAIFVFLFPLNKERFNKILKELEERRESSE